MEASQKTASSHIGSVPPMWRVPKAPEYRGRPSCQTAATKPGVRPVAAAVERVSVRAV